MCYVKYDISKMENISYIFANKSQTIIYTYINMQIIYLRNIFHLTLT